MDIQNIISLAQNYWGFISVALGFGGFAFFQREQAKKIILSLMLRLEKEAETLALNTGDEKLEFMMDKGYQLLPASVRLFVPQATFNGLVKSLYDKAKAYLIVQQAKNDNTIDIVKSPTESINSGTTVTITAPVVDIKDAVTQFTIEASQQAINKVLVDITSAINNSVKPNK